MKELTITYIGGGSKNWAQKYFADFLSQDKIGGTIRLYDINHKASKLNEVFFNKMVKDNKGKVNENVKVVVIDDIDRALRGADVVLISILPYTFINMYRDVHYAEKYGCFQPVGDSVGIGGYSRALRTLSTFEYFALKIKENCPDAWVINYTNPMSLCTNMLYKAYPSIKAIGCCHEVFTTEKLLCALYEIYDKLDDDGKKAFLESNLKETKKALKRARLKFNSYKRNSIDRHEISVNVQGINHFTFVNKASYKDFDLMKLYKAAVPMYIEETGVNPVKFEFYNDYQVFGAAGNRHLAEFVPDLALPLGKGIFLGKRGFKLTSVRFRIVRDIVRRCELWLQAHLPFKIKIKTSGEEGLYIISALFGEGDLISNVNIINNGQSPDLPFGTCTETNVKFSLNKMEAIDSGCIESPWLRDRCYLHALNQKDFVDAYFKNNKDGLKEVFLRDPQVSRLPDEVKDKLFNELIKKNRKVLPEWIVR